MACGFLRELCCDESGTLRMGKTAIENWEQFVHIDRESAPKFFLVELRSRLHYGFRPRRLSREPMPNVPKANNPTVEVGSGTQILGKSQSTLNASLKRGGFDEIMRLEKRYRKLLGEP